MKILILKPSSLGDVIHALPVLRLLKAHFPASQIHWWLDVSLVPLLEKDPDLAGIVQFQRKRWAAPQRWPEIARSLQSMRRQRFDWAIDLQGLARSGIFAWLAGAGLTVGLDNEREGTREGARLFYDLVPPRADTHTHAVDRYLAVLPLLGVPVHRNFQWLPPRPDIAAQLEQKWSVSAAPWILLMPGGRWNNKRWPVEYFEALVKLMASARRDVKFAILGSKDERGLGQTISAAAPERCLNLAGQTSLAEMMEWIRAGKLVITNDSGPMHVAAAIGRPVIALFGPTHPASTGPYGQLNNVLQDGTLPCVPCMRHKCAYRDPLACLYSIHPESVFEKARSILL